MYLTTIDLETTSKYPNQALPVSFSYMTFKDNLANVVDADTMIFWAPYYKWSKEAEAIHGISEKYAMKYADSFADNCRKMFRICYRGNLIGQNIKGYDFKVLQYFFSSQGYPAMIAQNLYDTMWVAGKKHTLSHLTQMFEIEDYIIEGLCNEYFKNKEMREIRRGFHSSEYDVVATTLLYIKFEDKLRYGK